MSQRKARQAAGGEGMMDSYSSASRTDEEKTLGKPHGDQASTEAASFRELMRGPDSKNILVLTFLYVLQGIPLGLAGSMPLIIQNSRGASYADQGFFSFVFWPFSLKLLWAPFVDSVYARVIGRRKSWLVPVQYAIAATMILLSTHVNGLLGEEGGGGDGSVMNINALTAAFFGLTFLAATQDIVVDGWALTMLSKDNVGWASTCNTVGQTAGYFLANVIFLALESKEFCNNYLRSTPADTGLVTLGGFLFFWGIVFLVSTTLVALLKSEKEGSPEDQPDGIKQTYKTLYSIIKLPAVFQYCLVLLTCKFAFATDSVAGLKLIEAGMAKDKLALIGVPMVPIQIFLPIVISKYTAGSRPFDVFIKAIPFRLLMGGVVMAVIVYITPLMKTGEHEFSYFYYFILLLSYALHQVPVYCMFTAVMSFHAKISDPLIGGTYMTLLNTVTNMGGNWCSTLALYMVDRLTLRTCETDSEGAAVCHTYLDGFYIEAAVCVTVGVLYQPFLRRKLSALQSLPPSQWTVKL